MTDPIDTEAVEGRETEDLRPVPAGKPVFFPVVNVIESAAPDAADEKKLLAAAKDYINGASDLKVTLDEKPIAGLDRFRVTSAVYWPHSAAASITTRSPFSVRLRLTS